MNKKITQSRINKETESLEKEPIPSILVKRDDLYNFHFCFYDLQEQFQGGFYHGLLELPQDYPFSPPKIKFLTNNGRFQVDKSICTSFTHYHKETWSASWNIRSILTAMISFMYSNERGIGGIFDPPAKRKQLAKKSLTENLKNQKFVELFKQKLIQLNLVNEEKISQITHESTPKTTRRKRKEKPTNSKKNQNPQQMEEIQLIAGQAVEGKVQGENASQSETICRKRKMMEQEDIAEYEFIVKKQKLNFEDRQQIENEDENALERFKTAQDEAQ